MPGSKTSATGRRRLKLRRTITIRAPARALYQFWRHVPNLAQLLPRLVTITAKSDDESHWTVAAPAGRTVEWDAVITRDEPDRQIAWRSREGAEIETAGSVRFESAPGDAGTKVILAVEYVPPGGWLGAAVARLTRDAAASHLDDALQRLKARLEGGTTSRAQRKPAARPPRGAKPAR